MKIRCIPGHVVMVVCLLAGSFVKGQAQDRCGVVEVMQNLRNKKSILESDVQFEQWMDKRKVNAAGRTNASEKFLIPVVVHVIHRGEAVGVGTNIPDEQIISQIKVLNNDFNRLNADASNTPAAFQSVAGSINIEFVLAKQSPSGDETTGIVRVKGAKSSWSTNDDAALKATSYWPAENYLNIWVTNLSSSLLGYAQFPVSNLAGLEDAEDERLTDGVVIDYAVFGSSDDGDFALNSEFDKGRTATHEVGHFLGLRHIWGDDDGACGGSGDYVSDTPDQGDYTSSECSEGPISSCSVNTMFQNYMDYSDDACMNLFTQEQVGRMITVMENSPRRVTLPDSPGLTEPDPNAVRDIAIVSIVEPSSVRCEETAIPTVIIKNNGTVTITSLKATYTLNNGTAKSSSFKDIAGFIPGTEIELNLPSITLAADENTLEVVISDLNGFSDKYPADNTKVRTVVVNTSSDVIPLRENFDSNSFENQWTMVNPSSGMNWEKITTNYNQSLYFNAATNEVEGDEAWLVSPVLDFSSATTASMFFDLSYRYLSTDGNRNSLDNLQVLASSDCGVTYDKVLFDETGTSLSIDESAVTSIPTSKEDWQRNYVNLTAFAGKSDVRLAFVFSNDNGNNIYLDNIEFFTSDDKNPNSVSSPFVVYDSDPITPSDFYITFNLTERQPVQYELVDVMGRQVVAQQLQDVLNQTYEVNAENTSSGIYFLRLKIGELYYTTKVFVDN
ncbi:M43 family zinc metalloprotease [Ohtaekwangia koreensis]|uniref:Por secretion system C-terminal sorting domain-containing protein n=1 Tax=Ohtaekwangia koreensis TaxID=688867 RepID=A0A1T5IRQ0_9BACT|nr:M43 family zinc metalloprotease [Ohtaekwangia koreensis]SKC41785.1 Por secretion system C-terminal sorting domain-containing protein [Ohtaekwangia koreensis]